MIVRLLRLKIYASTVEEASLEALKSSDSPYAGLSGGLVEHGGPGANDSVLDDERTLPDFTVEVAPRRIAPWTTPSLEQDTASAVDEECAPASLHASSGVTLVVSSGTEAS
jgi:hypothetical protein